MFSEESGLQLDTDGENLVFVTVVELPPKTGDSSQPALWALLALLSAALVTRLGKKRESVH